MDLGITNRLAMVTGASKGLGKAIAERLAAEGASLILLARSESELHALQKHLARNGRDHHVYMIDLSNEEVTASVAERIKTECGSPAIVVHNLGGSLSIKKPLAPLEDWKKVWHLNLGAAIQLNNVFIPDMVKKQWGRVVHISSAAAETYAASPAYVSAKAAVNAYVKVVGRALAQDNVILSAVSPGPLVGEGRYLTRLQTESPDLWEEYCKHHLPIRRLGKPEEIASAVAFLCSELSSYSVGSIMNIDGGSM